jgi:DNA topoisomerase-6 subunit B
MGITKKQAKEQFSTNKDSKRERIIEVLPIHIFFHTCSTKIPYKTAGKESIASEGELKAYMKSCLSELYRKLSNQIRKEMKIKEAENKLKLYKHYLPFIVDAITDSLGNKNSNLNESFSLLIERHLAKKSNTYDILDGNIVDNNMRSESTSDSSSSSPSYMQSSKTEKKDKTNTLNNSSKINTLDSIQNKNPDSFVQIQNTQKKNLTRSFSELDNKKRKNISNIHKKKKPKNHSNNNNSPKKKLENLTSKKLRINKKNNIQKQTRATDMQPTIDSFQNQRRVNKGKIR